MATHNLYVYPGSIWHTAAIVPQQFTDFQTRKNIPTTPTQTSLLRSSSQRHPTRTPSLLSLPVLLGKLFQASIPTHAVTIAAHDDMIKKHDQDPCKHDQDMTPHNIQIKNCLLLFFSLRLKLKVSATTSSNFHRKRSSDEKDTLHISSSAAAGSLKNSSRPQLPVQVPVYAVQKKFPAASWTPAYTTAWFLSN